LQKAGLCSLVYVIPRILRRATIRHPADDEGGAALETILSGRWPQIRGREGEQRGLWYPGSFRIDQAEWQGRWKQKQAGNYYLEDLEIVGRAPIRKLQVSTWPLLDRHSKQQVEFHSVAANQPPGCSYIDCSCMPIAGNSKAIASANVVRARPPFVIMGHRFSTCALPALPIVLAPFSSPFSLRPTFNSHLLC